MSAADASLEGRAAELRRAFDRAFAEPLDLARPAVEDLLAVRIAGDPCVVRLTEVSALVGGRPVSRLPGADPACLGLAGLRGAVVVVYDVAALLGTRSDGAPRWILLTAADPRLGLAFEEVDGHVRLPRAIVGEDGGDAAPAPQLVRGIVRIDGIARRLLHVPSIVDEVRRRTVRPRDRER